MTTAGLPGGATASDRFARALGSGRGARPDAAVIVTSREQVAADELRRLMDLAVAGEFAEPFEALAATAGHLNRNPASNADTLNMCVATQLVERTGAFTVALALALGWGELSDAFAAGLRSKMAAVVEQVPAAQRPAENWQAWMRSLWREHFPGLLAARMLDDARLCTSYLLGSQAGGEPFVLSTHSGWLQVAEAALTNPREHLEHPLNNLEVQVCFEAAAAALRDALSSAGLTGRYQGRP